MAGKIQLQQALQKTYELPLFIKNVLYPVFANRIKIYQSPLTETSNANATELKIIKSVKCYGQIDLDDGSSVRCYEIILNHGVRLEYNKVSIQQYVRKLLIAGQAILVNFYQPDDSKVWRLSLVASDSKIVDDKIEQVKTHAKRYTYLLGPSETCRTASERFAELESLKDINLENLIKAFSVEKLSKSFFDEYKLHYQAFNSYLINSDLRRSVFSIEKQEDENAAEYKAIRDFVKKMLGRIVFLYFVQKKGWLGASNTNYTDGDINFIKNLFSKSGGNEIFYPNYLCKLFFEALNTQRPNDLYTITYKDDKKETVCVPFLNGGLFETEKFHNKTITFPAKLFHNKINDEDPRYRGFLDFLNAYNFTIYEDSPDDHTVAVDPEMLGHIFENLLEDNKDKGAYYTPKEIVHYMCQESLIEYLNTKLNVFEVPIGYTGKGLTTDKPKSKPQQLTLTQIDLRDNIKRQEIEDFVKNKNANEFIFKNAKAIDAYLDTVKICDPAIGSGAFPMGLMQEIFSLKMVLHDFVFTTSNELFHLKDYDPKNYRSNVKLNIIQNSIYGVDIEHGAVDIARLRFWLSLIVDEPIPKALPNLDYKIVTGNSLVSKFDDDVIDIDWEVKAGTEATRKLHQQIHNNLERLFAKQKQFFNYKGDKHKLQNEIRDLKIEVLISQLQLDKYKYGEKNVSKGVLFEKTMKEKLQDAETALRIGTYNNTINKLQKLKLQPDKALNFFDWKLDFPEVMNKELNAETGFDIVVGNPPYIGEKGYSQIFEELKKIPAWNAYYRRRSNTYYFFIKAGVSLLRKSGVQCLIVPREFTNADWANKVRQEIVENSKVLEIVDFENIKVFNDAGTTSLILLIRKGCENDYLFRLKKITADYYNRKQLDAIDDIAINISKLRTIDYKPWNFGSFEIKSQEILVPLGDLFCISQGIVTGADRVTPKHVSSNLISKEFIDRGIFVLKEGKDIKIKGSSISVNINEEWVALAKDEKPIIKPYYKTESLQKWRVTNTTTYLIYLLNQHPTDNIQSYLFQFVDILINRATIIDDTKITFTQFKKFTQEEIKKIYSSAGAVQKIMRRKMWYAPLYERADVPFEECKIVVNTKNMDVFTYSDKALYSSGGGSGGQNFIYINKNCEYFSKKNDNFYSTYTKFICAILNSKLIQFYIQIGKYNQLSTAKIGDLKIPKIDFNNEVQKSLYHLIISKVDLLIDYYSEEQDGLNKSIQKIEREINHLVYTIYTIDYSQVKIIDPDFALSEEEYEKIKL